VLLRFRSLRGVFTRLGRAIGSVSPETHERLCRHHHQQASDADATHCVVTAFAAGEAYAVPVIVFAAPVPIQGMAVRTTEARPALPRVDHRLQPSCGPPAAFPLV
jgi:hypothetical protein